MVHCCLHLLLDDSERLFVSFISILCYCHTALRTAERKRKIFISPPRLGAKPTKSLIMTQPGCPVAARGAAALPRRSPAPIPRGPAGAEQDGLDVLQGLQPKGKFSLEQTCGWPGRIPLLVLPAQVGDRWKGEGKKMKPQSAHVVTSPTFAYLQMLVDHRGTFWTPAVAPPG